MKSRIQPKFPVAMVIWGCAAIGIPLATAVFLLASVLPERTISVRDTASVFARSAWSFQRQVIGHREEHRPQITNVQIVDLDRDGTTDILACDAVRNTVFWYRSNPQGEWSEQALCPENTFGDPAHATVVDLDQDADLDVIVSVLGSVVPTDDRVGSVVLLENMGDCRFESQRILDDVRRVADVQPGDLDQDGDLDLVVAEFGYAHGRVLWLENLGSGRFRDRLLKIAPGAIHVPVADYDSDGDLDVAVVISQDAEEVWIFENPGDGTFDVQGVRVWDTLNFDLGASGLIQSDLDRDGDQDLLLTAGDNLEFVYHTPQPWHGCLWLENRGNWRFEPHRIAELGGAYASATADLDADGDLDVVLASMLNDWRHEGSASLVWLENDGQQNFTTWQIDDSPAQLCTVACGDFNEDGYQDIVAGSLYTYDPVHRKGRLTAWINGRSRRE